MMTLSSLALMILGIVLLAGFAGFGLVSLGERAARAAWVAFALALATSLPLFLAAATLPATVQLAVLGAIAALILGGGVLWLLPIGSAKTHGRPSRRVDERDIMFARSRLKPGSPEFESYYARHPARRKEDDKTRSFPGLLSRDAALAEPVAFAAADASFAFTEALREAVDGPVAPARMERTPAAMTAMVKDLVLYHGARAVGVTELRPYHIYSHVGRGSGTWGEPIDLDHDYAVAFTVEMDHAVMSRAPEAPVVRESARQYVESARIGIQLATLIRSFGYPARAHIDGNYRVIAPLVARDAGLGEIGRLGLLMTPRLGPRVRIGVVTTDLPLVPDPPGDDPTVIDFCTVCKKCAENCPPGSIPFGERTPIDEAQRWAINVDTCFRYWNVVGTDCGRCMTVCPYSHPDNAAHQLVRWAIRRSGAARRLLNRMDDLFYGRRLPLPRQRRG